MIRSLLVALAAILFSAGVACAGRATPGCEKTEILVGSRQERTIEVDGVTRSYILDVPETVEARHVTPLLLDFHGFGHNAAGVWKVSGFRELGVRERFITVYPQGLDVHLLDRDGAGWEMFKIDGNRDVAFIRKLIEEIADTYCVDRTRVFSTGFSNGAFFSSLLGCVMADQIAAIAPVSGGALAIDCKPSRPVSAIIYHGRNDPVIPIERGRLAFEMWKKVDGCPGQKHASEGDPCTRAVDCRDGSAVLYCENDGEHRWPPEATVRIWAFFATHPMPGR